VFGRAGSFNVTITVKDKRGESASGSTEVGVVVAPLSPGSWTGDFCDDGRTVTGSISWYAGGA
jgi:hypothetical protein